MTIMLKQLIDVVADYIFVLVDVFVAVAGFFNLKNCRAL